MTWVLCSYETGQVAPFLNTVLAISAAEVPAGKYFAKNSSPSELTKRGMARIMLPEQLNLVLVEAMPIWMNSILTSSAPASYAKANPSPVMPPGNTLFP